MAIFLGDQIFRRSVFLARRISVYYLFQRSSTFGSYVARLRCVLTKSSSEMHFEVSAMSVMHTFVSKRGSSLIFW